MSITISLCNVKIGVRETDELNRLLHYLKTRTLRPLPLGEE